MLDVEGYPAQISALAVAAGLYWLRWTRPHLRRPFKAVVLVVWLYIGVCVSQVISPFLPSSWSPTGWEGKYALIGLGM